MQNNRLAMHFFSANSTMPRYFFHIKRGRMTTLDHEGVELADIAAAAKEAARLGREIAAREVSQGIAHTDGVIVVANQHWSPIFEVPIECDEAQG